MREPNTQSGWVKILALTPPSLKNNTADTDRLIEGLKRNISADSIHIDLELIQPLSEFLRKHAYRVRCVVFKDLDRYTLVGILDPDDAQIVAGLALDMGTTTVVMKLVDLQSHAVLGQAAFTNPQIQIGPDVLTRIHYSEMKEGLFELNRLLIEAINKNLETLCRACGFKKERIFIISAAGNTTMTHFFLGLSPRHLIREPYIPVINRIPLLFSEKIGIRIHPAGRVFVFPNIGSYFGGDLFAGILYSGMHEKDGVSLLVDVGTNAEVVLGNRDWLMACAGAAGPALEGGVTRMGMIAGPGVIDRISIDPITKKIRIRTIENQPPRGICGSGLIDLTAQLFRAGMIDIQGKWVLSACSKYLIKRGTEMHFVLVPAQEAATGVDLTLTQADLDSLIRSKAAMYTILETLAQTVGVSLEDIASFYVAGAFGSIVDPESAIGIGLLPDLPRDRFHVLGNSAIEGAVQALFSRESIDQVAKIREQTTYLELNVNQDFMNRFSAAKFIPHTDLSRFPSVKAGPPFRIDPEIPRDGIS